MYILFEILNMRLFNNIKRALFSVAYSKRAAKSYLKKLNELFEYNFLKLILPRYHQQIHYFILYYGE